MDKQPLVSVIIPTHNSARYIERCLEAVLTSTYSPYEVVVVDDASTDDTAELIGRYDVILFKFPQQSGPSAVRNHFASKTNGDILFFIDSDVQIYQNSITRVVTDFQKDTDTIERKGFLRGISVVDENIFVGMSASRSHGKFPHGRKLVLNRRACKSQGGWMIPAKFGNSIFSVLNVTHFYV